MLSFLESMAVCAREVHNLDDLAAFNYNNPSSTVAHQLVFV